MSVKSNKERDQEPYDKFLINLVCLVCTGEGSLSGSFAQTSLLWRLVCTKNIRKMLLSFFLVILCLILCYKRNGVWLDVLHSLMNEIVKSPERLKVYSWFGYRPLAFFSLLEEKYLYTKELTWIIWSVERQNFEVILQMDCFADECKCYVAWSNSSAILCSRKFPRAYV